MDLGCMFGFGECLGLSCFLSLEFLGEAMDSYCINLRAVCGDQVISHGLLLPISTRGDGIPSLIHQNKSVLPQCYEWSRVSAAEYCLHEVENLKVLSLHAFKLKCNPNRGTPTTERSAWYN